MGSVPRLCIFCGGTPLTNAHIFRKGWMDQLFPTTERFRHRRNRHEVGYEALSEWPAVAADFQVKRACARCNSDWMEKLDRAAEDAFLTRAAIGLDAKLVKPADKKVVARWCSLIAILFDQAQAVPRVGETVPTSLYAGEVPEGARVWLAQMQPNDGTPHAFAFAKDMKLSTPGKVGEEDIDQGEAYFITFGVGHFVAQVFIPTEETAEDIELNRHMNAALIKQLWPDLILPFVWPPPLALPGQQLEDFARAFRTIHFPG
jgi:hypothetical protein